MACSGNMGHGHHRGLESHVLRKDSITVSSELDVMAAACDLSTQDLESGASVGSLTRPWPLNKAPTLTSAYHLVSKECSYGVSTLFLNVSLKRHM